MTLASITGQLTSWVAAHGVAAVFLLMAVDALFPVGGEIVMLYAGVIAAGVVQSGHPTLFGASLQRGVVAYIVLVLAGTLGSLVGSLIGWAIGRVGGRPLVERHGRWFHLSPARFARAERWFERWGPLSVFLGRLTPIVRSFISIPAGALGSPLVQFTVLTLLASLVWCAAFAAVGWAVAGAWHSVDSAFRFVDYAVLGVFVAIAIAIVVRIWTRRRVTSEV
jgi:membrane protein DedA with SNARE-associated domain